MLDWLTTAVENDPQMSIPVISARLILGLLCGMLVAGSYRLTQGPLSTRSMSLMATLVLLTILIAMVALAVGNSAARAFSLVGALSIVRFRTVVEDTRDTAFVIFAVAVGMAAGAGYYQVPLVGIPLTAFVAYLFRPTSKSIATEFLERTLEIRIGIGRDLETTLQPLFQGHLQHWKLTSIATAKQGAAIQVVYHVKLQSEKSAIAIVTELNRVEGVQDIQLHSPS